MDKFSAFRILPILMIVAAICFGVRFSEMMGGGVLSAAELSKIEPTAGDEAAANATASTAKTPETKKDVAADAAAPPSQDTLPAKTDGKEAAAAAKDPTAKPQIEAPSLGAPPPPTAAKGDWKGADDLDDEYSEVKMELFSDLSKRRKDIEAKEKDLAMREALLKAGRAEIEQKYTELTTIKTDIETLLNKQTDEENKRIASLVKIYEGMKAKDAARIFNTLDMDVLLQVLTKMSERKSAPIIAAMDAEKARNVTIMLAEQNKLPSLPSLSGGTATP